MHHPVLSRALFAAFSYYCRGCALVHFARMNAFIFDMDGVLADNSDFHVKAWTDYSLQYGRELSVDDIKRRLGFNNREYMRFVLDREPTLAEVDKSTLEKEALYRELYHPHLVTPPGLIALLEFAKRENIVCGVATSAPEANVNFVLDGLNIRSYFREVVDASHVKHCKPDPEIYLLASKRLGVPPAECIVFEDALAGIQSANAAGMRVIAITTSYPAEILRASNPAAIITTFSDLVTSCPAAALIESATGKRPSF
jgi:beta-phosphoglucomutase family hydrolase